MGLRGPTPKPIPFLTSGGVPKCPRHLDKEARREWRRLVPILQRMRVLGEADQIALANLCQAYSTMVKAQEQLSKAGLLYKTQSGYIQQSPLLGIVNNCAELVTKLCREFGLTPAARTRFVGPSEREKRPVGPLAVLELRKQKQA